MTKTTTDGDGACAGPGRDVIVTEDMSGTLPVDTRARSLYLLVTLPHAGAELMFQSVLAVALLMQ